MTGRERLVIGLSAACFLAAALACAALLPSDREFDLLLVVALVIGHAAVSRVRFEFGNSYVVPEQLVFVPLLLLAPLPWVPLLVALAGVLAMAPDLLSRSWHRDRALGPLSDSWFALGPVLVLAALAPGGPRLGLVGVYLLAFAAQIALDLAWNLIRDSLTDRMSMQTILGTYFAAARFEAILAPVAFGVTLPAVDEPLILGAIGPLVWLLEILSRDRKARYSASLELQRANRGTVMLLADVVELDDSYTANHCRSVLDLAHSVAQRLGVDTETHQELEFAALLHDIGKISIPKEILHKPSPLSEAEFELMKTHAVEGQFMLDRVGGVLGRVGEIVRSCHERWDGGGYPDGLNGEQIPLEARIVFACDAFDAITTDRPYRHALSAEEALQELDAHAGTQFDPAVVAGLREVVEHGERLVAPAESNVRPLFVKKSAPSRIGAAV